MTTNNINPLNNIFLNQTNQSTSTKKENTSVSFADMLNNALNDVTADMKQAEDLSKQLVTGEVKDLHQVMIAMEKANLGLQLTVQVRNKIVEAYQEVMRMQV